LLTTDERLLQTAASLNSFALNSNGEVVNSSAAASEVVLSGLSELATSEHKEKPMNESTASILLKLRARASRADSIPLPPDQSVAVAGGQPSDSSGQLPSKPVVETSRPIERNHLDSSIPSGPTISAATPVASKLRATGKKEKDSAAKNAALERAAAVKKHLKTLKSELSKKSCSLEEMKSVMLL
jgi:hypothetical protein